MLGDELVRILYKGYGVPKSQGRGRYIDMGMSFKKGDTKTKHVVAKATPRRKSGELMEMVYQHVTHQWQGAKDIHYKIDAAVESTRNALENLTKLGRIESNGIKGFKRYRRAK